MDPKKKFKTMLKYNLLSDFSKLSISPDGNQIAILHLNQGNDLVFSLTSNDDKIGELVAILSSRLEKVFYKFIVDSYSNFYINIKT